jgi:hypothetical protein
MEGLRIISRFHIVPFLKPSQIIHVALSSLNISRQQVPVGVKQEARRTATNYLPAICIRPLPSAPSRLSSLSSSPMATLSPHLYQHSAGQIHGFNPPMQQTSLYQHALSPPQRGFTTPSSPQVHTACSCLCPLSFLCA